MNDSTKKGQKREQSIHGPKFDKQDNEAQYLNYKPNTKLPRMFEKKARFNVLIEEGREVESMAEDTTPEIAAVQESMEPNT